MTSLVVSMLEKVDHVIDRIDAVKRGSLRGSDTEEALKALADHFQEHRHQLEDFINDPPTASVVENHCDIILLDLFRYLPHIGFLHRARHPSNPFEVHGPLKRLAQQVIGDDVRLIISSEWEFSPYTHPSMGDVGGFVLLGLPASEADNALLVPIAGHEFGHPVWKRTQMALKFADCIERRVLDQMRARLAAVSSELGLADEKALQADARAVEVRAVLVENVRAQSEEVFCDLLGLLLFGESFCHAFAHLLAPGLIARQSSSYPTARHRAEIIAKTAERFGATTPVGFTEWFRVPLPPDLWSDVMAAAVDDLVEDLVAEVEAYAKAQGLAAPTVDGRAAARNAFEQAAPAPSSSTLPEIMCAGWDLWMRDNLWSSKPYLQGVRTRLINDLILKSSQALDYWHFVDMTP